MNTGTLAPLMNERKYTENEKTVLLHYFTNIDKNIYCALPTMSSQLWAFLIGQYSRSHLSLRDRFLQLFSDSKKAYEKGNISQEEYLDIDEVAEKIRSHQSLSLDFFEKKAADFLFKWGVQYGHNSLKDTDTIRYALEGVSQVATKILESPFPALGNFQEKSTRYLPYSEESLLFPPEIQGTEIETEYKNITESLIKTYIEWLPKIKNLLEQENIVEKTEGLSETAYKKTVEAKAFDICRYLLPTCITTSLGASFSTRTLESHISFLLSHPLEEIQLIGKSMHEEGKKISPGLLKHVEHNEYEKILRNTLDTECKQHNTLPKIFQGITQKDRVSILSLPDIETEIIASFLFQHSRTSGKSFSECKTQAQKLSHEEKKSFFKKALEPRGKFDRMPREMQHGSIQMEFLCDFGAFRDIQRHRASLQLFQGATAIHGYDYPEYCDKEAFQEFKQAYDTVMLRATHFCRTHISSYPYLSEYFGALGHLMRTTFEMHPGQLAYVLELRTTEQGHYSYRTLFQELFCQLKEKMPLFCEYIRVNLTQENSRAKQEALAEKKLQSHNSSSL
jgi:thymidylate synthase ThyX